MNYLYKKRILCITDADSNMIDEITVIEMKCFQSTRLICVEDINALGFINVKFGIVFTTGFGSSIDNLLEPGKRSIVLIGHGEYERELT